MPQWTVSIGRRAACARHPARARDPGPLRAASRAARWMRGRGSISDSGTCSTRSATRTGAGRRARPIRSCRPRARACIRFRSGPVHAGIIEPGHFRFTANGETVVRLEQRLGYVHKGIDSLMTGASLEKAARLAGRTSGDSTVAYALAFARAVEAALDIEVPPRAHDLRALMAELERLANHFGDIGAICNDASFSIMHAQCGILRERTLRTAEACFGHRLMMDRVVPGGVAADLAGGRHRPLALAARKRAAAISGADRDLRQHRVAAGPHRHHRDSAARTGAAVRRRRLCRPRLRPRLRRPARVPLSALRSAHVRRAGASTKATSMRACGCASARSSRAWR